jgi:hypothetical protein
MKTYSRHYCEKRHRRYYTAANCIWGRRAIWVEGDGPYATLAWCVDLSVRLHKTLAEAESSLRYINNKGCGHACEPYPDSHELIKLSPAILGLT